MSQKLIKKSFKNFETLKYTPEIYSIGHYRSEYTSFLSEKMNVLHDYWP